MSASAIKIGSSVRFKFIVKSITLAVPSPNSSLLLSLIDSMTKKPTSSNVAPSISGKLPPLSAINSSILMLNRPPVISGAKRPLIVTFSPSLPVNYVFGIPPTMLFVGCRHELSRSNVWKGIVARAKTNIPKIASAVFCNILPPKKTKSAVNFFQISPHFVSFFNSQLQPADVLSLAIPLIH